MKKPALLYLTVFSLLLISANLPVNPSSIAWEEVYNFDKSNVFVMEFYSKNNELMRTMHLKTHYQSNGGNYAVRMNTESKGNGTVVIIDKTNEVAIQIFGEVWLTDQVILPNDIGVFRACKMAAKHNTLSVPGFVMEMTTEDENGGKTLMKTVSLQNDENYAIDLKNVELSVAVNKINYFSF